MDQIVFYPYDIYLVACYECRILCGLSICNKIDDKIFHSISSYASMPNFKFDNSILCSLYIKYGFIAEGRNPGQGLRPRLWISSQGHKPYFIYREHTMLYQ